MAKTIDLEILRIEVRKLLDCLENSSNAGTLGWQEIFNYRTEKVYKLLSDYCGEGGKTPNIQPLLNTLDMNRPIRFNPEGGPLHLTIIEGGLRGRGDKRGRSHRYLHSLNKDKDGE